MTNQKRGRWIACEVEEAYLKDMRKEEKQNKKLASSKDRSKYKKTDLEKKHNQPKTPSTEGLLKGRVISIAPQAILVDTSTELFTCTLKGALKKEKNKLKNLVTVGDIVFFEKSDDKIGTIVQIAPRVSVLSRKDHLLQRNEQLIAANIDLVLITIAVVNPILKPALLDRYIIAAQKGGMQPVIVINKIDLLDNPKNSEEKQVFEEIIRAYTALNIPVIPVSVLQSRGLDDLKNIMKDKTSVFSGQSGTGKSSLINAIANTSILTGELVKKTNKGMHTTTTTNLLPLPFGGWCIDTPGIRSFGVWGLHKDEVRGYFEEILEYGQQCKYPNCTHTNEPSCAVKDAVNDGSISPIRYESYLKLISQEEWDSPS